MKRSRLGHKKKVRILILHSEKLGHFCFIKNNRVPKGLRSKYMSNATVNKIGKGEYKIMKTG